MFILECYKNQKMCNNVVDNYPHAFEFLPDYFLTQKICNKAVDTYHAAMQFIPECYKTQEMCDKAVDDFLPLKFVPVGLLQNKLKNLIRIHSLMMI